MNDKPIDPPAIPIHSELRQCQRCSSIGVPLFVSLRWCDACQGLRDPRRRKPAAAPTDEAEE